VTASSVEESLVEGSEPELGKAAVSEQELDVTAFGNYLFSACQAAGGMH